MKKGLASMLSLRSDLKTEKHGSAIGSIGRPRRALLLALFSLLGLGLGLSGSARAAGVSVGLLGIDGAQVEPGMGQALTDALSHHIPQLQGMRVEKSQQDLVEVKLVFGCTDENPSCMAKVGKSLAVNRLIYGSIRKQPQGGLYVVAIKQLNVADSTVEKFITEAVAPEVLRGNNPQLSELVQRWLRVLLIEGLRGGLRVVSEPMGASVRLDGVPVGVTPLNLPEVDVGDHLVNIDMLDFAGLSRSIRVRGGMVHEVTATLAPRGAISMGQKGGQTDWGRVLRITSYVAAGLAGASAIAAIGTWRGYSSAEDSATANLQQLQRQLTDNHTINNYRAFFGDSAALSSCSAQPGLMGNASYDGYQGDCQRGNTLAHASTGLWVMAGGFAVISVTTAVLAALRRPSMNRDAAAPAGSITDTQQSAPESPPAPLGSPAAPGAAPAPTDPGAAPSAPSANPAAAPSGPQSARHIELIGLSPMVGPDGAAMSAAFRF